MRPSSGVGMIDVSEDSYLETEAAGGFARD
jgi:hypothetical protein